MPVTEIGDPRLQALFGTNDPRDVRPSVRLPRRGFPPAMLAAIGLIFAVLLFVVLNERRTRQEQPAAQAAPSPVGAMTWQAPPQLYIPPEAAPVTEPAIQEEQRPAMHPVPGISPAPAQRPVTIQPVYVP